MRTLISILLLFVGLAVNAQSIFSPLPNRIKSAVVTKETPGKYSLSLKTDSSASIFTLTAQVNGMTYQLGSSSGGQLFNGIGIGLARTSYKIINNSPVPIWDVSLIFLTSLNIGQNNFEGAGGMLAIGFNPGYLIKLGGNVLIREGIMLVGTKGFTNLKPYLGTGIGLNF